MHIDTAYKIFGLSRSSSPSETDVKKLYRRLTLKCHPDKGGTKEDFQNLADAYQVILEDLESPQQHIPTHQHTSRQQPTPTHQHTPRQQPTSARSDGSDIRMPSWETMHEVHREENRAFRKVMEEQEEIKKKQQEAETRAFHESLKRQWAAENAGVRHPQWNNNGEGVVYDEKDIKLYETKQKINDLIYKLIQKVIEKDNQNFFDIIDNGNDEQAIELFYNYLTTEQDTIVVEYKDVFDKIIREKIKEIAWEYYKKAGGWAFGWGEITNSLKPFLKVMYRDCWKPGAGDYGIWLNCKNIRPTDFTANLNSVIRDKIKKNKEKYPKDGGKNNKKHKSRKHKSIKYKSIKYKSRKHKSIKYKSRKYKSRKHKSIKYKFRKYKSRKQIL